MEQFKYIGTDEQADNEYFFEKQPNGDLIRGGEMGWAHKIDASTKLINWVDVEHAEWRGNYAKAGGLKGYIKDLINDGLVEVIVGVV